MTKQEAWEMFKKTGKIKYYMIYSFIKLMRFYQKNYMNLDLKNTIINNQKIPISSMTLHFSSFYGITPVYTYTQENSENMNSIEYNDDVFLKMTISKYIISLDCLDKILKEELIKNIFSFYFRENIIKKPILQIQIVCIISGKHHRCVGMSIYKSRHSNH